MQHPAHAHAHAHTHTTYPHHIPTPHTHTTIPHQNPTPQSHTPYHRYDLDVLGDVLNDNPASSAPIQTRSSPRHAAGPPVERSGSRAPHLRRPEDATLLEISTGIPDDGGHLTPRRATQPTTTQRNATRDVTHAAPHHNTPYRATPNHTATQPKAAEPTPHRTPDPISRHAPLSTGVGGGVDSLGELASSRMRSAGPCSVRLVELPFRELASVLSPLIAQR